MVTTATTDALVLHVRVVTGAGGGPEKTILNSPRFLRNLGHDAVCAYLHPPGDPGFEVLQTRATELGAELISIPDRGLKDFSVIGKLLAVCRERDIKIWHGHDYKSNALGLLVSRFHPLRLVTTVHGWVETSWKTDLYYAVDRACLRRYERVVCVSEKLLEDCLAARVPVGKCSLIENAIDLDAYNPRADRAAARRALNLPTDRFVVGAVGRLSPEKGFDRLIESAQQLIDTGMPITVVIAGEGPLQTELQAQIDSCQSGEHIKLLGHVSDARRVFNALDAFVLSSRYEGLPNVLLEAFACGVPSIATAVGGVPQVVVDEQNGLLISPDNAEELTVALTRLIHNEDLQARLGQAGRETVENYFSFQFRMEKMGALYDELLGRPASIFEIPPPDSPDCGESDFPIHRGETEGSVPQTTALAVASRPHVAVIAPATQAATSLRVELTASPSAWTEYLANKGMTGFHQRAEWLTVLQRGLRHEPCCLQVTDGRRLVGVLPLALVSSRLFGRFLVSLPYLNASGVVADTSAAAQALIDRAITLADQLEVRYLELRHEQAIEHPGLVQAVTDKVHMRLPLPTSVDALWDGIKSKVRNQIRKAQKHEGFSVVWGGHEVLDEFYEVFCRNMRDLGTPPFSRQLFAAMLDALPEQTEFCCVRLSGRPVASGLLIHGPGTTEVPSASSLRAFNGTNCNMLLYWHLLSRAVERGQFIFDFGRSSRDSGTHAFKAQWGALESPADWQHYVRTGDARDMRPNNGKFDLMIRTWQKLPVWTTKVIGPEIVRGIP